MKKIVKRGDIYYADLSPVVGCEQGGIRPVIVIQNNTGNKHCPTVIVAAITSQNKKPMPTHINLSVNECKLSSDSTIMLEQVRTIDKNRLKNFVSSVTAEKMDEINQAILVVLGFLLRHNNKKCNKCLDKNKLFW